MIPKIFTPALFLLGALAVYASERPNILWITHEDTSYQYIGAYGNPNAQTPNIDRLAESGLLFEHAYSNAPVCAVARSTILTGMYANSQGTHHMRSRYPIPDFIKTYVHYLREAGYYCTNSWKTDYNTSNFGTEIWDESSREAHYKNREKDQPFFAIFNFTTTHESRLFPRNIDGFRERAEIPMEPRIDPAEVNLPAFLPDEPIFREDIAIYHDYVTLLDSQVGNVIRELEEAGLGDDTIIFYYSDHGGITPRTKRWLHDTGTHVPLIVYFPEKWKHLSSFEPGSKVSEPVAFVDLAPTLLSLIGTEIPEYMQGEAFLGPQRPDFKKEHVFLFGDRFDSRYKLRRGITDGEYRLIVNFHPNQAGVLPLRYPEGIRSWKHLKNLHAKGKGEPFTELYMRDAFPVVSLYHTDSDPWEVNNLSTDSEYQQILSELLTRLKAKMKETHDLGFIPETMFPEIEVLPYHYARESSRDYSAFIDLVFELTLEPQNPARLLKLAKNEEPLIRYWSIMAMLKEDSPSKEIKNALLTLQEDTSPTIASFATFALAKLDVPNHSIYVDALIQELMNSTDNGFRNQMINYVDCFQAIDKIPEDWVMQNKEGNAYFQWILQRHLSLASEASG